MTVKETLLEYLPERFKADNVLVKMLTYLVEKAGWTHDEIEEFCDELNEEFDKAVIHHNQPTIIEAFQPCWIFNPSTNKVYACNNSNEQAILLTEYFKEGQEAHYFYSNPTDEELAKVYFDYHNPTY